MRDFMNFCKDFNNMTKYWLKGENLKQNPYVTDFRVHPSIENVSGKIGVNWEEVTVLHAHQGDVIA